MADLLDVSYNEKAYFLFLDIYGPIGLTVNILGAISILMRSTPEMGAYKWYLLNYQFWGTLIDAAYSFIQIEVLFPLPGGRSAGYNAHIGFDDHLYDVLAFSLTAGSGAALVSCFVYRYNAVVSTLGGGISQPKLLVVTVILHLFMVSSIGILFNEARVPYDLAKQIFLDKYPYLEHIVHNKRINIYWAEVNPAILYFVVYATLLITCMSIVAIIFCMKTINALHHLRGLMTENAYKMNRSFTIILILQAVVPFSLLAIPLLVMLILLMGYFNHSTGIGMLCVAIMSTHASGNTIVLFVMVKNYRNFVFYLPLLVYRQFQRARNVWRVRKGLAPMPLWQSTPVSAVGTTGVGTSSFASHALA